MRSRPSTRYFKPQTRSSIQSTQRAQPRPIANCLRWGRKKHSAIVKPHTQAESMRKAVNSSERTARIGLPGKPRQIRHGAEQALRIAQQGEPVRAALEILVHDHDVLE